MSFPEFYWFDGTHYLHLSAPILTQFLTGSSPQSHRCVSFHFEVCLVHQPCTAGCSSEILNTTRKMIKFITLIYTTVNISGIRQQALTFELFWHSLEDSIRKLGDFLICELVVPDTLEYVPHGFSAGSPVVLHPSTHTVQNHPLTTCKITEIGLKLHGLRNTLWSLKQNKTKIIEINHFLKLISCFFYLGEFVVFFKDFYTALYLIKSLKIFLLLCNF